MGGIFKTECDEDIARVAALMKKAAEPDEPAVCSGKTSLPEVMDAMSDEDGQYFAEH